MIPRMIRFKGMAYASGVNRGQREHKGSFMGYPKIHMFLVEDRGSFRGYPSNYPP